MKNYIPVIFISDPLKDTTIGLKTDEYSINFSKLVEQVSGTILSILRRVFVQFLIQSVQWKGSILYTHLINNFESFKSFWDVW